MNVVPRCRAHRQHSGVSALRRVADAAAPGVVLDRITRPNHQLNPVGRIAAVVGYSYAKVPAVNWGPKPKTFIWNMTTFSRLFRFAVENDFKSVYIVQIKVQICTRSIPVVFPPQLDSITPTLSKGHIDNFVILATKPDPLISVRVRVASKPGILSRIARCVDPNDVACHSPIHGPQRTGAGWRSTVAGTV